MEQKVTGLFWNTGVKVTGATVHFVDEGADTRAPYTSAAGYGKDDDDMDSPSGPNGPG